VSEKNKAQFKLICLFKLFVARFLKRHLCLLLDHIFYFQICFVEVCFDVCVVAIATLDKKTSLNFLNLINGEVKLVGGFGISY
jgi:hypothetical protein